MTDELEEIRFDLDHIKYCVGYDGDNTLNEEEKEIVDSVGVNNVDYCTFAVFSHRHPDVDIEYNEDENYIRLGDKKLIGDLFRKNVSEEDLERINSNGHYKNIAFSVLLTEILAGEGVYPDDLKENQIEEVHTENFSVQFFKIIMQELQRRGQ